MADVPYVIVNIPKASPEEAAAGTNDNEFVTPLGLTSHFDAHIATEEQAVEGTNNDTTMTPLRVREAIDAWSGPGLPPFLSLNEAASAYIRSDVKVILTQFYAPNFAIPATLRGGASYIRTSKAVIDAAGYPTQAYFRSVDRFLPDGTESPTNGGYWVINSSSCGPDMFGAKIDGTTNDATAANACALFCCITGRQFNFVRGNMCVGSTIQFGRPVYDSLGWIKGVGGKYIDVPAQEAAFNSTNRLFNLNNYIAPSIFVESGACVIATFTASNVAPQAVISYNFFASGPPDSPVLFGAPLPIGIPINIASGKFNLDYNESLAIPNNGLIGMWFPSIQHSYIGDLYPCNMGFSGVASYISYQTKFRNIFATWCGDAATLWEHNSSSASVTGNYCDRGVAVYGDATEVDIGTQQCLDDMVFVGGDDPVIRMRYIEDAEGTDGTGHAAIVLGRSGGGTSQVRSPIIIGGRLGTLRPNKAGITGYGSSDISVIGLRTYSNSIIFDSNCTGTFINTDVSYADLPIGYFGVIDSGQSRSAVSFGIGTIAFQGAFRTTAGLSILVPVGAGLGSVAAVTKTITLPAGTVPPVSGGFDYQYISGDVRLAAAYSMLQARIVNFDVVTQNVTIQFINNGIADVTITDAFHVYFRFTNTDAYSVNP